MVLISILALILIIVTVTVIALVSVMGAGAIILFSDVIVCAALIIWIIRKILQRKKR